MKECQICWPMPTWVLEPSWLSLLVFSLTRNVDTFCGFQLSFYICVDLQPHWLQENHWFSERWLRINMAESELKKIQMSKFRPSMNFVWVKCGLNQISDLHPRDILSKYKMKYMITNMNNTFLKLKGFQPTNLLRQQHNKHMISNLLLVIRRRRCWVLAWRQDLRKSKPAKCTPSSLPQSLRWPKKIMFFTLFIFHIIDHCHTLYVQCHKKSFILSDCHDFCLFQISCYLGCFCTEISIRWNKRLLHHVLYIV